MKIKGKGGGRPTNRYQGPGTRTKEELEEEVSTVGILYRQGHTHEEITRRTGISKHAIVRCVKLIRKRYADSQIAKYAELVHEKRAQYQDILREAWDAWERSKLDSEKTVVETTTSASGRSGTRESIVREGRAGDTAYLRLILDTLQAEVKILGLEPQEAGPHNVIQINWADLSKVDGRVTVPDLIEQKLVALEALPVATDQNIQPAPP